MLYCCSAGSTSIVTSIVYTGVHESGVQVHVYIYKINNNSCETEDLVETHLVELTREDN